jgi:MFS transporter, PAT family, beta-lactamase induction signal transducer AmpG
MRWLTSFRVYLDRRILTVLLLGFSSGLPYLLVYSTLSAWLAEAGVSMAMIGLFSWASTAYAGKWIWSPLVDRLPLPVLSRLLGQRRAWLLLAQITLAVCMLGLGSSDPAHDLWATAAWAVGLAFAAATQDIAVDAYRVESLDQAQQAAGAGSIVLGYRLGMLAAGGGALILADIAGWRVAYTTMAALMTIGMLATLLSPEPARPQAAAAEARARRGPWSWLREAVAAPLLDFVRRPRWLLVVAFIALYKYGDALIGVMANPFYLDLGFSKTEIGVISKIYGVTTSIAGALLGGVVVARLGIMRGLLLCGVLQAASNLMFVAQAAIGPSVPFLMLTIGVENLSGGMGAAAFVAYLSSLCNLAYTATQYALVTSFMAFARTILASGGGWLAGQVSWAGYFLITTLAALPGLALLLWMMRVFPRDTDQVQVSALADDG